MRRDVLTLRRLIPLSHRCEPGHSTDSIVEVPGANVHSARLVIGFEYGPVTINRSFIPTEVCRNF